MAITGTGNATLDKLIKYWATLFGSKSDRADNTGPRNILDALFIAIKDHIEPGRQAVGYHYSVGVTGDVYSDDPTNADVPQWRCFNVTADMTAWAAPDGSIATIIHSTADSDTIYVRRNGAWVAR